MRADPRGQLVFTNMFQFSNMEQIFYTLAMLCIISNVEASIMPINMNKGPLENNLDISLLPMDEDPRKNVYLPITNMNPLETFDNLEISLLPSEDLKSTKEQPKIEQLLSLVGLKREEIEEVVKMYERTDSGVMESDLFTCAIKTVTSFIACMHLQKDRFQEPTEPTPLLKCLTQAVNIFVKCLISKQSTGVPDNYGPEFDIQNI